MDRIGAAVWATGRAGRVIVEAGLKRPWLEFRGGIVLTFNEIALERIADTTMWGHGILRDEGIGGPPETSGAGFMMRNFLVEALMLLAESAGLEIDEPVFESVPVLAADRRERAGYVVEPGTVWGHDRQVSANGHGGGRVDPV